MMERTGIKMDIAR